jgi:predicted phage-related endonuclease
MALHRYRIAKPTHGGQDWLNIRFRDEDGNKRVSASAVAAIYGLHPFVKRDQYAAELLGDVAPTPIPPNAAMERGNRLEDPIMNWAADRLGVPYVTPDEMFVCDSTNGARMVATLDGFYEDGDVRQVLEIKTTTRQWEGNLPDYWRIQGIQQAICADVEEVMWAVFDPSMNMHMYLQKVTPAEQAEHISAVEVWLNNIELGMVPPGVKWSYETIQARYQKPVNRIQELSSDTRELFDRLRHVRNELASYKEMEDQLKAEICELIGDADSAVIDGTTVATWKPQSRSSFDAKAFKEAYPELAAQFTKTTNTRMFLLKGER